MAKNIKFLDRDATINEVEEDDILWYEILYTYI